jgi:hypothetical protein
MSIPTSGGFATGDNKYRRMLHMSDADAQIPIDLVDEEAGEDGGAPLEGNCIRNAPAFAPASSACPASARMTLAYLTFSPKA